MLRTMQDKTFDAFVKLFGGDEDAARRWLEANVDVANRQIASRKLVTRSGGKRQVIHVTYRPGRRQHPAIIGPTDDLPSWRRQQLGLPALPKRPSWQERQLEVKATAGDLDAAASKTLRNMRTVR